MTCKRAKYDTSNRECDNKYTPTTGEKYCHTHETWCPDHKRDVVYPQLQVCPRCGSQNDWRVQGLFDRWFGRA